LARRQKKILVTGGLGFIGSNLVSELKRRNHEVWVCDLIHSGRLNYVRCDVSKYRQVERLFKEHDFDYVYHTAAEFGRSNGEAYYENLWITNAIGTKNIIKAQEQRDFRMIFTSSSEVYGDYQGIMSENITNEVPLQQLNDYAMSKWVNEMQIMNSTLKFSTETIRVRLFNTYGPGEYYSEYRSAICVFIYKAIHKLPYTVYTKHKRTSSYVDDTVRTLANIIENFNSGHVYNIAGNELHNMKMVSDYILKYLGIDDRLVNYKKAEEMTTLDKIVDISEAFRDLRHKATISIRDGIVKTIQWQKEIYG